MTQDEMERAIQFVLNQQAQFWVGMQELKERQEQTSKDVERLSDGLDTVVALVGRLAQAEIELTNRMAALAEAGKETQERLDAFIVFVEKYIETHNGGKPGRPD